jgi:hypothetical protein
MIRKRRPLIGWSATKSCDQRGSGISGSTIEVRFPVSRWRHHDGGHAPVPASNAEQALVLRRIALMPPEHLRQVSIADAVHAARIGDGNRFAM